MDVAPEDDPPLWPSLSHRARMDRRSQVWLERSVSWKGILGAWQGVKVLGQGGYGLCGLFKYVGSDQSRPRYIVVKQSGKPDRNLQNESRLLAQCRASGTPHVVKLYKSYHQEGGTGTSAKFDPFPYTNRPILGDVYALAKEVSRIYLEYCPRGDMWQWIMYLRHKYVRFPGLDSC
jgi:hypothetical protein